MTDKERLLAAGRIDKIGRGRVSKADREWLDANPLTDETGKIVKSVKPGNAPKVVADLPPARWPEGTKAVALDGSGVAGDRECCGPCGVHYRWCQCDLRLPPVPPRVIVGSRYTDVRLEAPGNS